MLTQKNISKASVILLLIIIVSGLGSASEEWTFTTCGSSGPTGPSQGDCDNEYENSNIDVDVNNGIQEWEAPYSARYTIDAYGAEGGSSDSPGGGDGAHISGEFELDEGETIEILVGQRGSGTDNGRNDRAYTGGGGGTFVTEENPSNDNDILIIAGGGGGVSHGNSIPSDSHGQTGECGGDGSGPDDSAGGGCNGNAGGTATTGSWPAYGGSGYDDGTSGSSSFLNGGQSSSGYWDGMHGGFGSGGAGDDSGSHSRSSGGGGYSGGGAARGGTSSTSRAAAGGGGSYNDGSNQEGSSGANSGQGMLVISLEGPIVSNPRPAESNTGSPIDTTDAELRVDVEHPDDNQDIEVTFFDDSNNEQIGSTSTVNSDQTASENWEDLSPGEHDWYVEACDENDVCIEEGSWTFEVDVDEPDVALDFDDYDDEHGFDAVADIEFDQDEEDYEESCYFNVTNGDQEYNHLEGDFEPSGGREATCEKMVYPESNDDRYDSGDGLFEGFEVWDDIDVTVNVTDEGIGSTIEEDTNPIRNQDPIIELNNPSDGGIELEDDVELSIQIHNPEGDEMDVEMRKQDEGETLYSSSNYDDGSTVSTTWEDRGLGTHEWDVVVSDPYDEVTSSTWSFERVVSSSYRPGLGVDYVYSSLVVSEGDTGFTFFEIENDQATRDFTTFLEGEGIEPYFVEEDDSLKTYELESGHSNRMHIGVEGLEPGEHELGIITKDHDLGVNTTETFPVFVQSSEAESRGIPGLSIYYVGLIYLLAVSFLWFSV